MPYPYYPNMQQGFQNQYYPQSAPMMDHLAQLRQGQTQIPVQAQSQMQPMRDNGSPIWVQGEAGARGYLVAAGNTVLLMDSESPVFYLKSVDANNIPQPLRVFDYTERNMEVKPPQTTPESPKSAVEYATRKELHALEEKIRSMIPMSTPKETAKGKKATKEDEENV